MPNPLQLIRMFEANEITREQFQKQMAVHQRELIDEMEENRLNPLAAYVDSLLNRRAAAKLALKHGEDRLREIFFALSEVPGFPPAKYLWNAGHTHVPLHCFIRSRREPVFRVAELQVMPQVAHITVEHGSAGRTKAMREEMTFRRDRKGTFQLEKRLRMA